MSDETSTQRLGLFFAWSAVIAVATWLTWNPVIRFASTVEQSAGIWALTLLHLPAALAGRAPALLWVAALVYSQWALGGWLGRLGMRRFGTPGLGHVERIVIGQVVQGLAVLGLGMVGLLYPPLLVTLVLGVVAARLLAHGDLRFLFDLVGGLRAWRPSRPTVSVEGVLGAAALFLMGAALTVALATTLHPVWFYDVLAYHFGTPNQWLVDHGCAPNLNDVLSFFPGHNEALVALAMAGGGLPAAQVFNLSFILLLVAWIREARFIGGASWRLAGLLLLTTPVLLLTASLSKPDIALGLYASITFDLTLVGARRGDLPTLGVAGLFGGLCFASKYTAVPLIWWPALATAGAMALARRRHVAVGKGLGLWLAAASVIAAPWLLRNAVWTGNPFYPALFGLFGGEGWSEAQAVLLDSDAHRRGFADFAAGDFWWLVWGLTFSAWSSLIERFGAFGVMGPAFLWLAPVALWRLRREPTARWAWGLAGLAIVTWFFTSWILRFLAVGLPFAALMISRGLGDWRKKGGITWAVTAGVGLLILAANGTYVMREVLTHTAGMAVVAGDRTDESFRRAMAGRRPIELGTYDLMRYLDALRPGRVMLVGDTVHAYVTAPHLHASALNPPVIVPYLAAAEPAEMAAHLRADGFTHLLVNPQELARMGRRHELLALSTGQHERLVAFLISAQVRCLAGDCTGQAPGLFALQ